MSYNITATPRFKRELKRLSKKFPSLKNEYIALIQDLEENPSLGTPIGNDCYKIRLSIESKGKGKSGGSRVISHLYVEGSTVFLLTIYDKGEQDDIPDNEDFKLVKNIQK